MLCVFCFMFVVTLLVCYWVCVNVHVFICALCAWKACFCLCVCFSAQVCVEPGFGLCMFCAYICVGRLPLIDVF